MKMIGANELRIGNYVSLELAEAGTPYECIVVGIEQDRVYYLPWLKMQPRADFLYSLYCYVYPIPLTEEWLLKFGFQKNDINNDYKYWLIDDSRFLIQTDKFYFSAWLNIIESVNQLQNLYFALKGKELTIKEK